MAAIQTVTQHLDDNEKQLYTLGAQAGMTQQQVTTFIQQYGLNVDQQFGNIDQALSDSAGLLSTYMDLLNQA